MTTKKTKPKNTFVKKSSIINMLIWISLASISLGIYYTNPIFHLDESQILYLFSAASQVIAAIYGLIITGYIFLRNELDRKADKDDSFEEVVSVLKGEYFGSIITISIVTVLSISLCFLVIVDATSFQTTALDILINIFVSVILIELILIVSFVIKILNPKSLEIASDKLRAKTITSDSSEKGSIEDFLTNFNTIEYILTKYGTSIRNPDLTDYESAKRKRISNQKLVNILYNDGKIDTSLKTELINLISFRNSLIHGSNLFVSKQDVELSEEVLRRLKNALGVL